MSAKRLGILVFVLAFGLNLVGFFFFGRLKAFEDTRSIWLPELPKTAAPWDAQSSIMSGPAQGLVGTLARPDGGTYLADTWDWNPLQRTLQVRLRDGLTYSTGEPIVAADFVDTRSYLHAELLKIGFTPEQFPEKFRVWDNAKVEVLTQGLKIQFKQDVDPVSVLSSVWSGVLHQSNRLPGFVVLDPAKWVSSGPYIVRKWKPKEVILASRKDFPGSLRTNQFRTVRMSAASVRNPSADLVSTGPTESEMTSEHQKLIGNFGFVHALAICRSYAKEGSVCQDPALARALKDALLGQSPVPSGIFTGHTIAYRIAPGAETFRTTIPKEIERIAVAGGGVPKALSSIFDPAEAADLELSFVVTSDEDPLEASRLAVLGARLNQSVTSTGTGLTLEQRLTRVIPLAVYQQSYQMKRKSGLPFTDVFVR